MGKNASENEAFNRQRKNNRAFVSEEFAEPLDEHTAEEQERTQRTGDDRMSETNREGHNNR
ncbi:hypothetical protein EWH99_02050 [Sporolactobacillus sp. THM7-7]|nr:hypothetical protein EWH99_02050 [Sporolactobacillus sp. THM7-7]